MKAHMNYKTTIFLKDEKIKKKHGYKKIQLAGMLEINQFGIEYKDLQRMAIRIYGYSQHSCVPEVPWKERSFKGNQ